MMIYRSLVVGLLGAIALLVAEQGTLLERAAAPPTPVTVPATWTAAPLGVDEDGPATIVHISRSGAGADPAAALGISCGERVVAVDDVAVSDRFAPDALRSRWAAAPPGSYFELVVEGERLRRLLVLVLP